MIDRFGRDVTELRISVTADCNLNCIYCHREGEQDSKKQLTYDQIIKTVAQFIVRGVRKVKITGGEPLLRNDIVQIVEGISKLQGNVEISIVTNGLLLVQKAKALKGAGLTRVNIGCDSISSPVLLKNIQNIGSGLKAAKEVGLNPIKLNMVVLAGVNVSEIDKMIEFARSQGVILQLIELINTDEDFFRKYHYSLNEFENKLKGKANLTVERRHKSRSQYYLDDVVVEVVRPNSRDFCLQCNKIRVTSDGRIKPCLRVFDTYRSISEAIDARIIGYLEDD